MAENDDSRTRDASEPDLRSGSSPGALTPSASSPAAESSLRPDPDATAAAGAEPDAHSEVADPEAPDPDAPAQRRRPRFPWKSLIAVVIIFLLVLPVFSTLQPAYYERYPALRPRIDAWRQSTHALVPCSGCHVNPGPIGFLSFAARSIPAFYSQLVVGPNSTNLLRVPDRRACQKCHVAYRQVSPAGDLLIPHRAHVEVLGINCPVCHKNLVHSKNSLGYNAPEMQTCLTLCHNGVKATNQCDKCHTKKQVPPSHHQANWLQIHPTMVGKIDCGQCHAWQPDYCKACHANRPPTHVGNWKQLHQFAVQKEGDKGCLFCHGQAFCKQCH